MGEPSIIVSLTAIRSRADSLHTVLRSLVEQTLRPSRIILWLSSASYMNDQGFEDVPPGVGSLQSAGSIEIRWTDNTGPYRKLLPVLQETWDQDVLLVTADDDTLYPTDWLKQLMQAHSEAPDCVIAYRVRLMHQTGGKLSPYLEWAFPSYYHPMEHSAYFPTGKDGVLYRPRFFDERIFNKDFLRKCPTNDDIWFRAGTIANGVRVRRVNRVHWDFPETRSTEAARLFDGNAERNDRMIEDTFPLFGITADSLRQILTPYERTKLTALGFFSGVRGTAGKIARRILSQSKRGEPKQPRLR